MSKRKPKFPKFRPTHNSHTGVSMSEGWPLLYTNDTTDKIEINLNGQVSATARHIQIFLKIDNDTHVLNLQRNYR